MNRVAFQKGNADNQIAFVFSCPGRKELELNNVCQGCTGENLSILIKYCYNLYPEIFTYEDKSNYLITNASDVVHTKTLDGKTEASNKEILDKNNLKRLKKELSEKQIVICMGAKAKLAIDNADINCYIIYFEHHLSNQKLNRLYPNKLFPNISESSLRRKKRIELVAEQLIQKFKNN